MRGIRSARVSYKLLHIAIYLTRDTRTPTPLQHHKPRGVCSIVNTIYLVDADRLQLPLKYREVESEISSIIVLLFFVDVGVNGKTYLAKHPYFSKNVFHTMYPNYKKVLEAKKKYDPKWLFSSSATRRLLEDK